MRFLVRYMKSILRKLIIFLLVLYFMFMIFRFSAWAQEQEFEGEIDYTDYLEDVLDNLDDIEVEIESLKSILETIVESRFIEDEETGEITDIYLSTMEQILDKLEEVKTPEIQEVQIQNDLETRLFHIEILLIFILGFYVIKVVRFRWFK